MKPTVILFVQYGCEACAQAEPIFEDFKNLHPTQGAFILKADGPYPSQYGVKVKYTPTYAIILGGKKVSAVEGTIMTVKQIEKWLKEAENVLEGRDDHR